jgi:hypothetical protein
VRYGNAPPNLTGMVGTRPIWWIREIHELAQWIAVGFVPVLCRGTAETGSEGSVKTGDCYRHRRTTRCRKSSVIT